MRRRSGPSWRRHRTQFDCVDYGTDRDVAQRKVVAGLDVSVGTCLYGVTLGQLVQGDDVTLGAINVVQEGDASRAVRIVLISATRALTPSLSWRRKSIRRYWRLWPPPL